MKKHFVVFCSPGTFFNETTEKSIDSWDVDKAVEMAKSVIERYNAIPFGFYFTTRERKKDELDSKKTKESGMYFLGGTIYTLKQIKDRNNPDDRILISNMENNGYNKNKASLSSRFKILCC